MERNNSSAYPPQQPSSNQQRSRRAQRKRLRRIIDISTVVLVILLIALMIMQANSKDELAGSWSSDYIIVDFNGKGKGVWYQGDDVEKFTYKIDGDTVSLDFNRDNVQDLTYTFSLEDGNLALSDADGDQLSLHQIQ